MRRSHLAAWQPHCPVCFGRRGIRPRLGLADGAGGNDADVRAGILVCGDPGCRHEYPIVDGIPVIMPELRRHLAERGVELLLRDDLDPAVLSLIGDALGPDSWLDAVRQTVSTYAWDAWGDLDPAETEHGAGEPEPGAARRCLRALLALAGEEAGAAGSEPGSGGRRMLDLGCGGGRTAFDLAAGAPDALVLGVDGNLALLRLARRVATTGAGGYDRRRIGLSYDRRRFEAPLPGRERVDFWCCDASALPFPDGAADLVLALNLLDCVPEPARLLRGIAGALRDGGLLLLATPFDWSARATPVEHWIGGHSQRGPGGGAAEPLLRALLDPGAADGGSGAGDGGGIARLRLLGEADGAWHTRLHERAAVSYRTRLLAARRAGS